MPGLRVLQKIACAYHRQGTQRLSRKPDLDSEPLLQEVLSGWKESRDVSSAGQLL